MLLETDRLRIRKFEENDTPFILRLLNSPGWLKYIGDRNVKNELDALNYLKNGPIKSYSENGFGLCLVLLKELSIPIGMCGFLKRSYLIHPDIGFAFLPEFERQGFGKESASAMIRNFANEFAVAKIMAITTPENIASKALLESLGFSFEEQRDVDGRGEILNIFSRSMKI